MRSNTRETRQVAGRHVPGAPTWERRATPSFPRGSGGRQGQQGQSIVLLALLLPLFLAVIGVTIDAGTIFAARREAQNLADAAARAGANELNVAAYRLYDGDVVVLDRTLARLVAEQYLADQGVGSTGLGAVVDAREEEILVTVWRDVPLGFLQLIGQRTVEIRATAVAEPFVSEAGGP